MLEKLIFVSYLDQVQSRKHVKISSVGEKTLKSVQFKTKVNMKDTRNNIRNNTRNNIKTTFDATTNAFILLLSDSKGSLHLYNLTEHFSALNF